MAKSNNKRVVISTLNNSGKESLPISTLGTKVLILNTKEIDIAMIVANAYELKFLLYPWKTWNIK